MHTESATSFCRQAPMIDVDRICENLRAAFERFEERSRRRRAGAIMRHVDGRVLQDIGYDRVSQSVARHAAD